MRTCLSPRRQLVEVADSPLPKGKSTSSMLYDSANGDDGYTVGICSRTALLRQAQADLDALGEGRAPRGQRRAVSAPEPPQDSGVGWAWLIIPIVAATGLVVGGMVRCTEE